MLKIIFIFLFLLIIISLFSSLFFLIKDKGNKKRAVNALKVRIGLSVLLFAILIIMYMNGYIQPHGI
ncbi:MAG: twin transmembrane helix small protein [Gammaproteobacteria bacterium]|nr:twin transmembrane helix small protein [Gammaproteobacteria bacterium]MBT6755635.1 twin transmembrane helix small protein [Gammaproteobacteria bacterium]MBT7523880.1 twin transmembrane helix small protein [Gammaproteobacteria bacterium]MBT7815057.1 twin transmembrane helix small protein [Gammaproteobacteria bacterium]MDA9181366.1 twin transmembrane helix small protein [Gammaproteobacteria bacterium]